MAEDLLEEDITSRVEKVVREHVGSGEALPLQVHLQDELEIDSLERVEIAVKLEKLFDLELPNDRVRSSTTLGDLVQVVIDAERDKIVQGAS